MQPRPERLVTSRLVRRAWLTWEKGLNLTASQQMRAVLEAVAPDLEQAGYLRAKKEKPDAAE